MSNQKLEELTGRIAKEAEEIVLQGIGHEERRNILKIVRASPEGVSYSEHRVPK